jgi:hypothetical protein
LGGAAANKSAVRDFTARDFTGHQNPQAQAGRLVL